MTYSPIETLPIVLLVRCDIFENTDKLLSRRIIRNANSGMAAIVGSI